MDDHFTLDDTRDDACARRSPASLYADLDRLVLANSCARQSDLFVFGKQSPEFYQALAASLAERTGAGALRPLHDAADGLPLFDVAVYEELPGQGLRGVVNGRRYHLGPLPLLEALGMPPRDFEGLLARLAREGKTPLFLTNASQVVAVFAVTEGLCAEDARSPSPATGTSPLPSDQFLFLSGRNLVLAVGIKLAFITLVLGEQVTLWMAVLAELGVSLLMAGNGLRLLRTPR